MSARGLVLGVALVSLAACATTSGPPKPRALTPGERDGLSRTLNPLLTAAGLWRGPADGCPADFGVLESDLVAVALKPHAPCRVRLILTQGAMTRLDRATLGALLAHEIAHMQLSHPDARQARADAQKQTEKQVKTASSAASTAAGLIPGVGGLVSKGISTARKGVIAAMELGGNPYLPEEEQAADAMAATLLNESGASGCRALVALLEDRLRSPKEEAWALWLDVHPDSAERIEALAGPCPGAAAS
jgi:hypothetical protein